MSDLAFWRTQNISSGLSSRMQRRLPLLFVLLLGATLGLQYASAKGAGAHDISPLGSLFVIQAALFVGFLGLLAARRRLFRPSFPQLLYFMGFALTGSIGPLSAELMIAPHIPAGHLALIMGLIPVMTLVLVAMLRTERLSAHKIVGVVSGFAAAAAILLPVAFTEKMASLDWTAAAFLIPFSCAISIVVTSRFAPEGLDAMQIATGNLGLGSLLVLPMALASGEAVDVRAYAGEAQISLLIFALTIGLEFYLLVAVTRAGGAITASCSDLVAVCAGLGWAYLLFTEIPGLWTLLAATLCLASLVLAASGKCERADERL